jgi:hypothetical protein
MAKISCATAKAYLPVLFACHCPPLLKKRQNLVPTVSKNINLHTYTQEQLRLNKLSAHFIAWVKNGLAIATIDILPVNRE